MASREQRGLEQGRVRSTLWAALIERFGPAKTAALGICFVLGLGGGMWAGLLGFSTYPPLLLANRFIGAWEAPVLGLGMIFLTALFGRLLARYAPGTPAWLVAIGLVVLPGAPGLLLWANGAFDSSHTVEAETVVIQVSREGDRRSRFRRFVTVRSWIHGRETVDLPATGERCQGIRPGDQAAVHVRSGLLGLRWVTLGRTWHSDNGPSR